MNRTALKQTSLESQADSFRKEEAQMVVSRRVVRGGHLGGHVRGQGSMASVNLNS